MTPGRRTLSYGRFDRIMPDVERLLEGCTTVGNRSLAQICRHPAAAAYCKASSGPVIPHPSIGPLTKAEWDRFHLIHCAHHLSFAIPAA
jgi:hypothetical protein